jgi:hypothetical protein
LQCSQKRIGRFLDTQLQSLRCKTFWRSRVRNRPATFHKSLIAPIVPGCALELLEFDPAHFEIREAITKIRPQRNRRSH